MGVNLTTAQKGLIASFEAAGNVADANKIVLDALTASVGGQAGAENTGLYGGTRSLKKAWEDLLITLGNSGATQVATQSLGALSELVKNLDASMEQFHGAETFSKGDGRHAHLACVCLCDRAADRYERSAKGIGRARCRRTDDIG